MPVAAEPERWSPPPTDDLQVLADVWPATVRLPLVADPRPSSAADPLTPARLVVTYTPSAAALALHVFSDSHVGPARVYTSLLPLSPAPAVPAPTATSGAIPTDDGTLFWTRETGCGCGSALKGFRPFPGAPLAEAPPPTA